MNGETAAKSEKLKSEILEIIDLEHLNSVLMDTGAPLSLWGTGNTKTVEHLFNEIANNEAKLVMNSTGEIERHIQVAIVEVLHISKNATVYGLREQKQVFNDGRIRERSLSTSLGEKVKNGETPRDAGIRALSEELNIHNIDEFMEFRPRTEIEPSNSYPGLITSSETHPFMAMIDANSFNPDGYIEKQADKTNYYVWDIVNG